MFNNCNCLNKVPRGRNVAKYIESLMHTRIDDYSQANICYLRSWLHLQNKCLHRLNVHTTDNVRAQQWSDALGNELQVFYVSLQLFYGI